MFERLEKFFRWQSELLKAKRYDDLADQQVYPFAIFQEERQTIVEDADEAGRLFIMLRARLATRGVKHVTTRLTAVDLPRNGRFRAWICHEEFDVSGNMLTSCKVVHYCVETHSGTKTEMSEYTRCSLPEIWESPMPFRKLA